ATSARTRPSPRPAAVPPRRATACARRCSRIPSWRPPSMASISTTCSILRTISASPSRPQPQLRPKGEMTVTLDYPNRVERLTAWLAEARLDCAVVFGADHVNHLAGYHRYFGGASALAVGADGSRTLVVALDEAPIARELSLADEVVPYGVRGFGLDLDPLGSLIPVVAGLDVVATSHRIGVASEFPGAVARFAAAASSAA